MNAVDYIDSHGMTDKSLLWRAASGGDKAHNSQMDIVIELWKANLINY
ncbi:MAG: hypothetical protein J7L71_06805 [Spirochaetaceae bacterium]|nr:hypothetical protein [Spirochaetaceae bacterium]